MALADVGAGQGEAAELDLPDERYVLINSSWGPGYFRRCLLCDARSVRRAPDARGHV
jgi:hypothetical protein